MTQPTALDRLVNSVRFFHDYFELYSCARMYKTNFPERFAEASRDPRYLAYCNAQAMLTAQEKSA